MAEIYALHVLIASLAGWMNRQQGEVLEYLIEENRVLKEQLKGKPLRLPDRRVEQRKPAIKRELDVGRVITPNGESDEVTTGLRADLGDLLFCAGQFEEAKRVLSDLISEYPRMSRGYCHLAELFRESDPRQALAILEQAKAALVRDGADYDFDARIAGFRRSLDT